jgi:Phosphorylase superfamily
MSSTPRKDKTLSPQEISLRKKIARDLIDSQLSIEQEYLTPLSKTKVGGGPDAIAAAVYELAAIPEPQWPDPSFAPVISPIDPVPTPDDALPISDWVIITWTQAEHEALRRVFTRSVTINKWYPYRHNFDTYIDDIRPNAPARHANRLGSYYPVTMGDEKKKVLCFKCELHLNQDGTKLPLQRLIKQIVEETQTQYLLSIGTAGGVGNDDELGDVVVSHSALFKLQDEFKNSPFNHKSFTSNWNMNRKFFDGTCNIMNSLQEPAYAPPTKRIPFDGPPVKLPPNKPDIKYFENHPIITTDYFEYGTSNNHLDEIGSAVEMDDAVIAMVCDSIQPKPRYAFVRNVSDPVINGDLDHIVGSMWAAWFYQQYGLKTSFNGALATWAIVAGN